MKHWFSPIALISLIAVAGCVEVVESGPVTRPTPQAAARPAPAMPTRDRVQQFITVVERVEPVAERECRARAPRLNCDFRIVVDDRPGQPANAYQTVDRSGQPILAFTLAMIASVRNPDELAFVMGHEAAHHIAGHIPRQQQNAATGAILLGGLAAMTGASQAAVDQAVEIGAGVGARSYSKNFELEADALGTVITHRAGYNPVKGAAFFSQIPDPGNRFLGTHPPNAQRLETVRRVAAGL
ncbi:Peptidase family M48 [Roseovarius azorensis]|uniref:Peptidase family M48 n=1 Tax=Roseovarius azorensis TaxID=1287727 RepID=A0A1H7UV62_9RHOB|nr:M48 family metallopeptidase [Roseovarius azorensis]SEM00862.1 Peptidase family M48 [Roseovarius azorensis]